MNFVTVAQQQHLSTEFLVIAGIIVLAIIIPIVIKLFKAGRRVIGSLVGIGAISASSGTAIGIPKINGQYPENTTLENIGRFINDIDLKSIMITATICIVVILITYFLLSTVSNNAKIKSQQKLQHPDRQSTPPAEYGDEVAIVYNDQKRDYQ